MTAAELMTELEADPAWVAAREAEDRQRELDDEVSRQEQQPLLEDLAAVGVTVDDVYDLLLTRATDRAALPVLVDHLHRDYDDHILDAIARALGVKEATPWWDEVVAMLRATPADRNGLRQGLGVALSEMATREQLPEVRSALRDTGLGRGRIFLLGTLTRLRAPDRWDLIAELADDPDLRTQARHMLHQRDLRSEAARRRASQQRG